MGMKVDLHWEKSFVAIDFDGTVTDVDITDNILQTFARTEWQEVETLWEKGIIGSRECLTLQMSMISSPLDKLLDYIDQFTIDRSFTDFISFLNESLLPFAIISDGFRVLIERILSNSGLTQIPIFANTLREENGKLKILFPYSNPDCRSANCKCTVIDSLSNGLPVILIGDGRSDFCFAEKARCAFTKNKLTEYCTIKGIAHFPFDTFKDIEECLRIMNNPYLNCLSDIGLSDKAEEESLKIAENPIPGYRKER